MDFKRYLARTKKERKMSRLRTNETLMQKRYVVGKEINRGGFGRVYDATRVRDGLSVAIKKLTKSKICDWVRLNGHRAPLEVALMKRVAGVKGCVELIDWCELPSSFDIVMERVNGKDMFDVLTVNKSFTEYKCWVYFEQVVAMAIGCRKVGVVHRDIKDENLIVESNARTLKLIDFGCGAFSGTKDSLFDEFSGTVQYSTPEWLQLGMYRGGSSTVWTLGLLLFNMVCGDIPFKTDAEICCGQLNFNGKASAPMRRLIERMLSVNSTLRPTLDDILKDDWMLKMAALAAAGDETSS